MGKTYSIRLTKAELWFLVNAIPQAGYEGDPAGESVSNKVGDVWSAIREGNHEHDR